MRTVTKLVPFLIFGVAAVGQACGSVTYDTGAQEFAVKGVIRGTLTYDGIPPCSQGGHVVGNAVILVFDRRNPPPPSGLGTTAVNFGVVSGDTLFHDWPVTQGAAEVCPDPSTAPQIVTAPFAIAPMDPGSYYIQAFYDYTGDFLPTFKFRQLPEATDVGGGAIDLNDANSLTPNFAAPPIMEADGGITYPLIPRQADPNFQPKFLNIDVGTPGAVPAGSLRGVPTFTMPPEGYIADDVQVFVGARLPLARPYFYPQGTEPFGETNPNPAVVIPADGASSDLRPASVTTPQNPGGNPDFVPVLSFPQDMGVYAQPVRGVGIQEAINQFQASFPALRLNAGVPAGEQQIAADVADPRHPFHMQLGLPIPGAAPNGNGGIFVWWDGTHTEADCAGLSNCTPQALNSVPENPLIPRLWPLVVLAKLNDLPTGVSQPNPADPESLVPQGSDLSKPIVIIQGITLAGDALFWNAQGATCANTDTSGGDNCITPGGTPTLTSILSHPDATNLQSHVTALVRPSVVCLDPRHPDRGGVLVTPAPAVTDAGTIVGPFPPADTVERTPTGTVVDTAILSNPQLAKLINTGAPGTHNGLQLGCLPKGRYAVNLVYPTGQAWTTPNEIGSCATLEGNTLFASGAGFDPGSCSIKPRPVLHSQGTRAVVEITGPSNPANCLAATPDGTTVPAVPAVCTTLTGD